MLWTEFLAGLDAVRVQLRSSIDLRKPLEVDFNSPIVNELRQLCEPHITSVHPAPAAQQGSPAPDLGDIWSEPESLAVKPAPAVAYVSERPASEGGGTMKVLAREAPFVPKTPKLEEATEETVGK